MCILDTQGYSICYTQGGFTLFIHTEGYSLFNGGGEGRLGRGSDAIWEGDNKVYNLFTLYFTVLNQLIIGYRHVGVGLRVLS